MIDKNKLVQTAVYIQYSFRYNNAKSIHKRELSSVKIYRYALYLLRVYDDNNCYMISYKKTYVIPLGILVEFFFFSLSCARKPDCGGNTYYYEHNSTRAIMHNINARVHIIVIIIIMINYRPRRRRRRRLALGINIYIYVYNTTSVYRRRIVPTLQYTYLQYYNTHRCRRTVRRLHEKNWSRVELLFRSYLYRCTTRTNHYFSLTRVSRQAHRGRA